jgi:hypothetical protein
MLPDDRAAVGDPRRRPDVRLLRIPTWLASALWSITAKIFRPFADKMPVRRETVSVTDLGLTLVVISVSVQSAITGLLSASVGWLPTTVSIRPRRRS